MTHQEAIQVLRDWHDTVVVHPDNECDYCAAISELVKREQRLHDAIKDALDWLDSDPVMPRSAGEILRAAIIEGRG
jgi:hypothetical protein